jgi:hypothetical protein
MSLTCNYFSYSKRFLELINIIKIYNKIPSLSFLEMMVGNIGINWLAGNVWPLGDVAD